MCLFIGIFDEKKQRMSNLLQLQMDCSQFISLVFYECNIFFHPVPNLQYINRFLPRTTINDPSSSLDRASAGEDGAVEGILTRKHEWESTTKKASNRSWDKVRRAVGY